MGLLDSLIGSFASGQSSSSTGAIGSALLGLLEPIGNLPPAEAEAAYYAQLDVTGIAA